MDSEPGSGTALGGSPLITSSSGPETRSVREAVVQITPAVGRRAGPPQEYVPFALPSVEK